MAVKTFYTFKDIQEEYVKFQYLPPNGLKALLYFKVASAKAKNINVPELAKRANVSQSTLYSIIKRNNLKVDINVLIKISDVLCVNTDYFYDRKTPYDFSLKEIDL